MKVYRKAIGFRPEAARLAGVGMLLPVSPLFDAKGSHITRQLHAGMMMKTDAPTNRYRREKNFRSIWNELTMRPCPYGGKCPASPDMALALPIPRVIDRFSISGWADQGSRVP
jgi:hypothetical protein